MMVALKVCAESKSASKSSAVGVSASSESGASAGSDSGASASEESGAGGPASTDGLGDESSLLEGDGEEPCDGDGALDGLDGDGAKLVPGGDALGEFAGVSVAVTRVIKLMNARATRAKRRSIMKIF
ncbi:hypothetical protein L1987_75748 [Smallanthus sonchifolius]|uniref:Uncharacterized protein n=1 Tax=Smallanthus sonchifolius TaxID=185202 RepID=A0ACB9A5K9_9ASTR|nr:hypothetical protein L1987_75748 [Smallanthus sonchifolius]